MLIKVHPPTARQSRSKSSLFHLVAELDLDYLERRGGDRFEPEATSGSASNKEEDSPADTLERVKVIILGAAGVGKTSIIRVSTILFLFFFIFFYLMNNVIRCGELLEL